MGLLDELRETALGARIDLLGATSAEPLEVRDAWRHYDQPHDLVEAARSVVVAGFCPRYEPRHVASEPGSPRGRFTPFGSRVFEQMEQYCFGIVAEFLRGRGYQAAAAPEIPIKPAIVRAGLGRYGRHGVVITPQLGSMAMFACVVTDAPLADAADDSPVYLETCAADCRLCVDACPTGALAGDYRLDRSKCITNWLWGAFSPRDLRPHQGARLFGCAECLLACPRNAAIPPRSEYPTAVDTVDDCPELIPLIAGDRDYYDRSIPTFPRQAGFGTMRRSATVAAGNVADPGATDVLGEALGDRDDRELRAYAAWSLGRIGSARASKLLADARRLESEPLVREEIAAALGE